MQRLVNRRMNCILVLKRLDRNGSYAGAVHLGMLACEDDVDATKALAHTRWVEQLIHLFDTYLGIHSGRWLNPSAFSFRLVPGSDRDIGILKRKLTGILNFEIH